MDWDKIRVFYTVAEAGSFTHAGENLHLSQSAISRQIGSLEESLNVSLFHDLSRELRHVIKRVHLQVVAVCKIIVNSKNLCFLNISAKIIFKSFIAC